MKIISFGTPCSCSDGAAAFVMIMVSSEEGASAEQTDRCAEEKKLDLLPDGRRGRGRGRDTTGGCFHGDTSDDGLLERIIQTMLRMSYFDCFVLNFLQCQSGTGFTK
jgi:hypothetical protein